MEMMWATKLLLVMGVVVARQDDGGQNYAELGEILKIMVLSIFFRPFSFLAKMTKCKYINLWLLVRLG